MADNVNINVEETNEIINIVASEVQEVIDINVFETAENVTLNITEDIIEVNINKVTAAEQIQSDWNQTDVDALDFIKNKPTIPSAASITDEFYCIARLPLNSTTWELINDLNHEPSSNIQGITSNPASGFNFSIQHNNGFTKVGSVVATVDESYASFGLKIGASVGLTESLFRITKDGFSIRALVSGGVFQFANDVGQIVKSTDFSYTFDTTTGLMVISHPTLVCTYGDGVVLTPYTSGAYSVKLVTRTPTSISLEFYTSAGVKATALSSSMKLYITRTGTFQVTNEQIGNNNANFWIRGIMKK